jgi:hypothetical protein
MMEERWKAEERKEIIGEEWRKISRIMDKWEEKFRGSGHLDIWHGRTKMLRSYTVKKGCDTPVPSRDVTNQTLKPLPRRE